MAKCTSSVPLTAEEAASKVAPTTLAAANLDHWAATNAADSYGGLEARSTSYVVHIVRSAASAAALTRRVADTTGFTTINAAWSLSRLQSTGDEIAKTPGPLSLFDVHPDVASNHVIVISRTAAAAAVDRFRAAWAGVPLSIRFDDVTTYTRDDRLTDSQPWFGGDRILLHYTILLGTEVIETCSSGLPIYGPGDYGAGTRYGTTAGHCGTVTSTICQGTKCGAAYGTPTRFVDYQYSDGDEASYANNAYPAAYIEAPGRPADFRLFVGSRDAIVGDGICADGSLTGQSCGGRLEDGATHCITFSNLRTNCGLQVIDSNHSLSQGGDSGGPVYTYDTVGGVTGLLGLGIIVGERTNTNGHVTVLSPVSTMRKALGFTDVMTNANYSQTCC